MNVFIIHGSFGHPEENWIPWLKKQLEHEGHTVFVPTFSTPQEQSLNRWKNEFQPYVEQIDEESIFVGHSIGPAFILSILEDIQFSIKGCFFISGFLGLLDIPKFDSINETFTTKSFDWKKIRAHSRQFTIFHADNDPYVPIAKAKELATRVGTIVVIVKNAGHFNDSSGYSTFSLLFQSIQDLDSQE